MSLLGEWGINLKFNFKAIRFNLWLSFFLFAALVLLLLGTLQFVLIRPHFRSAKTKEVIALSDYIEEKLISNLYTNQKEFDAVFNTVINTDVCVVIYNRQGNVVYSLDSIGETCVLNAELEVNQQHYRFTTKKSNALELLDHGVLDISYNSKGTEREMFLYGKKISQKHENFYLFINGSLEPIDSYLKFISTQYLAFTIIIIVVSILFAYFLASKFSIPLINMKKNAEVLAQGQYAKAKFDGGYYSEYQVLATALNDATDKLAKIDTMRKELLANISHDIKTPLTMIEAYSEMIKDLSGDDPIKRNEHLDIIINESKYLDRLVTDLLELSKLQSKAYVLKKENFELNQLILDTVKSYEALLVSKELQLNLQLKDVVVFADKLKIQQVVNNYLSNAIKYSYPASTIQIKVIERKDRYRIEFIDQSDGITLEEQPYLWDRYYKIDKNFKRSISQTGLGLAIVKAIIEAHQGKYGVQSTEKVGSCFYFELFKEVEQNDAS